MRLETAKDMAAYKDDDKEAYFERNNLEETQETEEAWEESRELREEYGQIRTWRERRGWSQAQMSAALEIPARTIEDWERFRKFAPHYVLKLLVEELKRETERFYEKQMKKYANKQKNDEDGNRPVIKWATIDRGRDVEWVKLYDSMAAALAEAEPETEVACILTNNGTEAWFVDKNGDVASDNWFFTV